MVVVESVCSIVIYHGQLYYKSTRVRPLDCKFFEITARENKFEKKRGALRVRLEVSFRVAY